MGRIIGIDLGTTNSCVSVMDESGKPVVIQNAEGQRTTPSIVGYSKGERLVGQPAKNQMITNAKNTIFSVKRFMGRAYAEVTEELAMIPYTVTSGNGDGVKIDVDGKHLSPPEISAAILQKMKETAEDYLGEPVTEAVVTFPSYFNDAQRQATKDAGRIAGLDVKRIVNEPTAAALSYGFGKKQDKEEIVAVYDLGGGTFDISILELADGVFEVKSTNGDTHLGGDNFDHEIITWLVSEFKKDHGVDLSKDTMALQRLKEAAEKAKKELSSTQTSDINLPFITADATGPKHLQYNLTRAKFDQMTEALVQRSKLPCEKALKDAGLTPADIDEVLLVGGSTRIPAVQELVRKIFGKEPNKGVNPDEVVAMGAAIQGGVLGGKVDDIILLDVTPLSLGLETLGGVMTKLIERNTTIPTKKSQVFSTAADNQTAVSIVCLQGEREMAKDNRVLGKFDLVSIPAAPRGVPQIEVTFDIDANGIVHVSAKDLGTGKEQKIRIESSSGLTDAEIEKMVKDAEIHAESDRLAKEKVEIRNNADSLVFQTEKSLKDYGDKISADEKKAIEKAIEDVKEALKSDNTEEIKAKTETLTTAAHKLAEEMYKQEGAGAQGSNPEEVDPTQGQSGQKSEPKKAKDAEDADFEVVD